MDQDPGIVNKVASSGLVTIDLGSLVSPVELEEFDLAPFLWEELILREKDFREKLKFLDWEYYRNKWVAIHCSTDAIIPSWAFMLVAVCLEPIAGNILFGKKEQLLEKQFSLAIQSLDINLYRGQKVVIKGCSKEAVPLSAYIDLTARLRPVVKSIMYGEPCSTVPIYKKTQGNVDL